MPGRATNHTYFCSDMSDRFTDDTKTIRFVPSDYAWILHGNQIQCGVLVQNGLKKYLSESAALVVGTYKNVLQLITSDDCGTQ